MTSRFSPIPGSNALHALMPIPSCGLGLKYTVVDDGDGWITVNWWLLGPLWSMPLKCRTSARSLPSGRVFVNGLGTRGS